MSCKGLRAPVEVTPEFSPVLTVDSSDESALDMPAICAPNPCVVLPMKDSGLKVVTDDEQIMCVEPVDSSVNMIAIRAVPSLECSYSVMQSPSSCLIDQSLGRVIKYAQPIDGRSR